MSVAVATRRELPILFESELAQKVHRGLKTQTRRPVRWRSKRADEVHDGESEGNMLMGTKSGGMWPFYVYDGMEIPLSPPYGHAGDLLYVRENFTYLESPNSYPEITPRRNESNRPADGVRYQRWMSRVSAHDPGGEDFLVYKADGSRRSLAEWPYPHEIYEHCVGRFGKTIPSIHMPKWAARTWLEVTKVRAERIQRISLDDCDAEGVPVRCELCGYTEFDQRAHLDHSLCKGTIPPINAFSKRWDARYPGSWDRNDWVWVYDLRKVEAPPR